MTETMTFREFSVFNRRRCEAGHGFNHPIGDWSLSDWFTATMGELGEAANIAKKLNRARDGIPGNSETTDELSAALADEIADTFIYLDLLAQSAGINLGEAVISKFNRTSEKIGYRNVLFNRTIVSEATPEPQKEEAENDDDKEESTDAD